MPVIQGAELGPAIRKTAEAQGLRKRTPYDLGILLVHGIGEQERGDTLTEAGDLLLEWLRRGAEATGSAAGVDLNLMEVVSRQASGDDIAGAHAQIRITPPAEGGPPANWVIGESFWADVFRPASYGELGGWGIFIGPWAFAAQVRGIVQRMEIGAGVPRLLRFALLPIVLLVAAAMFLLAAFIGLAVTVLAIGLVVLVYTGIPFLADFARSTQRGLANGVGDAYVLTRSPIRFGAMSSQVRSDLRQMCQECKAVAVVAHSQGTAVAWHAIKHELTDNPSDDSPVAKRLRLFLTYGQAVRKLTFMRCIAQMPMTRHRLLAVLGAGFALLTVAELPTVGPGWLMLATLALAIASEAALVWQAAPLWVQSGREIEPDWKTVLKVAPKLEWLDLWASADPVPGGPLDLNAPRIRSVKIRNLSSGVLDHVVYWKNATEYLAILTARMFGLSGLRHYASELNDPLLVASTMRRHARVLALMTMRVVVAGAALACALQAWWTPGFSAGVMDFLKQLQLPFVAEFFNAPPLWTRSLAGVVVVLAATLLVWIPIASTWGALIGTDEETYLQGLPGEPLWGARWYALGVAVLALAIGVGVLLVVLGNPVLAGFYAVGTTLATLLALTIFASGGRMLSDPELPESPMDAVRQVTGGQGSSVAVTAVIAVVVVAIPVAVALVSPAALGWTLAIEGLVVSAVLAVEGVREYRLFTASFATANDPPTP